MTCGGIRSPIAYTPQEVKAYLAIFCSLGPAGTLSLLGIWFLHVSGQGFNYGRYAQAKTTPFPNEELRLPGLDIGIKPEAIHGIIFAFNGFEAIVVGAVGLRDNRRGMG